MVAVLKMAGLLILSLSKNFSAGPNPFDTCRLSPSIRGINFETQKFCQNPLLTIYSSSICNVMCVCDTRWSHLRAMDRDGIGDIFFLNRYCVSGL